MPRLPRITRQHAAALLLRNPDSTLLALDDGHLAVLDAGEFINRGRGRIILTGSELLDAGAELTSTGTRRLSNGSGPIVDAILESINRDLDTENDVS
ncbi:hypothetical protein [Nocardia brasiliensis]|uniref:hypothetical protein n=1 Tax=Nocardia brasiliensis TaxID=37326 RepID=UPI0004A6BE11|nr:hypothetical protein [Nocardia brasiliensis]